MRNSLLAVVAIAAVLLLPGFALALEDEAPVAPEAPAAPAPSHPVCWLEFATQDAAASTKFYHDVFGWDIAPVAGQEQYFTFTTPEGQAGGFNGAAGPETQLLIPFIYVEDIDSALAALAPRGAAELGEQRTVPGAKQGRQQLLTDCCSVVLGLSDVAPTTDYTPDPLGGGTAPTAGTVCNLELYSSDFTKTTEFYAGALAWETAAVGEKYMAFNPGNGVGGVFQAHTPDVPVLAYIWTDDIEAAVQAVTAAGGELFDEILDAGELGRFAYLAEPGGILFGLIGK